MTALAEISHGPDTSLLLGTIGRVSTKNPLFHSDKIL